jgi:glycerophosphoryl diester phosphodiesterase
MEDQRGVALAVGNRRVMLKWHKLRRAADQPPFAVANLRAGLALDASLEVDVRRLADDSWVCLHDAVLEEETNGAGPVTAADADAVRSLRIAGADFAPPLLAELALAIAAAASTAACLQFDLQEPRATLTVKAVANFAAAVGPVARACLLSGGDWAAVQQLGAHVPGLRLGYDPIDEMAHRQLDTAESISAFLEEVVAMAPSAATYYLDYRFVSAAVDRGVNAVRRLQVAGAMVDIWTLDPTTPEIETVLPAMIATGADQITTNDPVGLTTLWRRLSWAASS